MKKNKVLFVDDEMRVLNSIRRSTMNEDYETFVAGKGEEALQIMEENEISVLVTDMRMPGMDGLTLLKIVKEKYPNIVRMVLSGYNQLPQILSTINQVGVSKFITKPWVVEEEFLPAIRESVEYYNLRQEGEELKKTLVNRNNAYQNILKANNETMSLIQKDLANINKFYEIIQNVNKAMIDKIKDYNVLSQQLNVFNDIAKSIFTEFVSLHPTKIEDITVIKLAKEIEDAFKEKVSFDGLEETITSKGNYKLILLVVKELCKELTKDVKEGKLIVDINEHSKERIILSISKGKNPNIKYDGSILTQIIYLLNSVSNIGKGSVILDGENIRMLFTF